jgi:hypothetical protein
MIMDNRTNKRNTFRPGNLLIASAALLLMMVSMGYTFPFVNQDQKSGISVLNDSSWSSYTTDNGLASNNILSIATDHDGVVWIGTDTGITSYANRKFNNY